MLTIGAMGAGQASYYLNLAGEDYYIKGGEPPGHWYGQGASEIGLEGHVTPEHLYNLFDGLSPDGSESFVQRQRHSDRSAHRPGWDLTFSAPKSVSALWSQLNHQQRQEIQQAHEMAVKAALDYIQDTCLFTRRRRGDVELEPTKMVAALFEHSTSRALDPQLHTHALLLNVGVRSDHTIGAVSSMAIFQAKMTAGALYRAELAAQLQDRMGLELRRERSWFEVKWVPQRLIDEFSKRRKTIEEGLEAKGQTSAKAAAQVAMETRERKEEVSRDNLFGQWRVIGKHHSGFAFNFENLIGMLRNPPTPPEEVVAAAIARITKSSPHFSERDLMRFAAEEAQGLGVSGRAVRQAVPMHLANSEDIVRLGSWNGVQRFTTRSVKEFEDELLGMAQEFNESEEFAADPAATLSGLATNPHLNEEQMKAVFHVTAKTGRLGIVSGMAGTGKTTMLKAAREVWEKLGYEVVGATLSAQAAQELTKGSKIHASTIAKIRYDISQGKAPITNKTVLVVDEAGMVSSKEMAFLFWSAAKAGAKIVLVGDERQLQPIGVGAPFLEMGARFGRATLTEVRRQEEGWARQATKDMADGRIREALSAFAERGGVRISASKATALDDIINAWSNDGMDQKDKIILTGTRKDRAEVNGRAQSARREAQELTGFGANVNGERFYIGDRVQFTENYKRLGIVNGLRGTIRHIDSDGFSIALDDGPTVTVSGRTLKSLQLGYATTTHKAQGATVMASYVLIGGAMQDKEMSYVQASRAKKSTMFFMTKADAGDDLDEICRSMQRSRQKDMASTAAREAHEQARKLVQQSQRLRP